MRDSITEIGKLFIPQSKWGQYDIRVLNKAQMQIKASGEMLKFVRGQVTLADWLTHNYEESASASMLMGFCSTRQNLYRKLSQIGYTWDEKIRLWRLMRNRKSPRPAVRD